MAIINACNFLHTSLLFHLCYAEIHGALVFLIRMLLFFATGELPFLEAKVAKQMLSSHRSSSQWSLRDLSSGDTKGYYPRQVPEIDDGWEEMFITYRDFEVAERFESCFN